MTGTNRQVLTNELTEYAPDWMDGSFDAKPGGGWYKAEDVDAEIERLRAALKKIACIHVAFPEENFPGYASMAIVTAREAIGDKPTGFPRRG